MLEINLLPEELKVKNQRAEKESKYFVYLIIILPLFAIAILVNICLFSVGALKAYQLSALNRKWDSLEPQRKTLQEFSKEYEGDFSAGGTIKQAINRRMNWAEKLNKLSLDLPVGIWFNEIIVSQKDFVLKGSVISLQKEELNLINKLIDNLKKDEGFFYGLNTLELTSIKKKALAGYDIVDFILTGSLKFNDKLTK